MLDFSRARQNMIEGQLRPNRVTDPRLLAAIADLPREHFLPEPLKHIAYVDDDIPLGRGRFLIEPLVLCRMLQVADVKASDKVLDVACSTGYSTALLARLAHDVTGLENDPELAQQAQQNLARVGIANAKVVTGALQEGWAAAAPYDLIVIGGTIREVPAALQAQLADGGRLLTVISNGIVAGTARLLQRVGKSVSSRPLFDAGTPQLPGFDAKPGFVF